MLTRSASTRYATSDPDMLTNLVGHSPGSSYIYGAAKKPSTDNLQSPVQSRKQPVKTEDSQSTIQPTLHEAKDPLSLEQCRHSGSWSISKTSRKQTQDKVNSTHFQAIC